MTVDNPTQRIRGTEHGGDGDPRLLARGGGHVGDTVACSLENRGTGTLVDESDGGSRCVSDPVDSTYCGSPASVEELEPVFERVTALTVR